MSLSISTRPSDSPWVSSVWSGRSDSVEVMTSVASETWGLVFSQQPGGTLAAITGPETKTGSAPVPEGAQFVGIQFAVGTSLRVSPTAALVDSGILLPDTTRRSFRLDGSRWEIPTTDDAEALVAGLIRGGVILRDPLVAAALDGAGAFASDRTIERRFRSATGMTRSTVAGIQRARAAGQLLLAGDSAPDVVESCGYYDEPHLARALRRYVGRTARQLRDRTGGAIALD